MSGEPLGPPVSLGAPVDTAITQQTTQSRIEPLGESDIGSSNVHRLTTPESGPAESLASSRTMSVPSPSTQEISSPPKDKLNEKAITSRSSNEDASLNEKHQKQEIIELQDGLVYLGTEAQSGKAIIKQKDQLQGGPYTIPKWLVPSYLAFVPATDILCILGDTRCHLSIPNIRLLLHQHRSKTRPICPISRRRGSLSCSFYGYNPSWHSAQDEN